MRDLNGESQGAVRLLPQEEKGRARALWEEVFPEDSAQFLDYYDACVAPQNRIYAEEADGRVVAMLHRNPYRVHAGETQADVSYLVAVATRREYRRQGRMARLLQRALADSCRDGEPFVYLMPASEKIYLPHGFRTVGYQSVLTLGGVFAPQYGAHAGGKTLACRRAKRSQIKELAAFSERCLSECCMVYTKRDEAYFQRIWKEQKAVNGGVLVFYEKERLAGYCFCALEDGAEIWEAVADPATPQMYAALLHAVTEYYQKELPLKVSGMLPGAQVQGISPREFAYRPMTMVRLTNLYALAERLRARRRLEAAVEVQDALIPQNNGCFHLIVDEGGGRLEKLPWRTLPLSFSVEDLTEFLFGLRARAPLSGLGFDVWHPVYLNELV